MDVIREDQIPLVGEYFKEVVSRLAETGGNISAGYTFESSSGGGRWEVIITHGNPGGRDSLQAVGVGSTFLGAMQNAMNVFRGQ